MKRKRIIYAVSLIAVCYCCISFVGITILDTEQESRDEQLRVLRSSAAEYPWDHHHHQSVVSIPQLSSCPPPPPSHPPHCSTNPRTVLVVGALHSLGAWLTIRLSDSGGRGDSSWTVRGVALESEITTQRLLWYRHDQLTAVGVNVEFKNFSNSSHVEDIVAGVNPSHIIFIPRGLERGETPPLNSVYLGDQMRCLVALLENQKCSQFILISRSLSASGHMTITQAHMTSLEAALLAYHSIHGTQFSILRTGPLYGPWTNHSLQSSFLTSDLSDNDWYIDDVATAITSSLTRGPFCRHIDLSPCPDESPPTLHNLASLLNISTRQPADKGLKKSLYWAKAYKKQIKEDKSNDVILTSYFTSTHDYQRNKSVSPNRSGYMLQWMKSVRDLGLRAIVFHDELDPAFQQRVSKFHPGISFRHVTPPLNSTTNDARFYAYLIYLHLTPDLDHILLTDISDVRFQHNPFQLMRLLGDRLYVGTDIDIFPNMASQRWISEGLERCFGSHDLHHGHLEKLMSQQTVFNAGVIGGSRHILLALLERVTQYLDTTDPSLNCNMPAVNYVIHRYFYGQVFTGFPLTSRFFSFQSSPKAVYIIHK